MVVAIHFSHVSHTYKPKDSGLDQDLQLPAEPADAADKTAVFMQKLLGVLQV